MSFDVILSDNKGSNFQFYFVNEYDDKVLKLLIKYQQTKFCKNAALCTL